MLKITIITVCRNEKARAEETIESVCAQTYPNTEYLIIDGASDDGTVAMLQEYSLKYKNIKFYSEKDFGIYNAMNRGIARAGGDYVFFINAGDLFYSEHVIEDMVSYMEEDTESIYYGMTCLVYADGLKQVQDFSKQNGTLEEKLLNGYMPNHQAIFAPRNLLTDNYFREQYKMRADYEWLVYSVSRGCRCVGVPVIVSYYDVSGASSRVKNNVLLRQEGQAVINEYWKYYVQNDLEENRKEKEADREVTEQKYYHMFQFMNYWMAVKQKGVSIGEYLLERGYGHIAVYGIGSMGLRLVDELKGCNIEIEYAVDRNADNLRTDLSVLLPDETLPEVDLMIVTAVTYFNEIAEHLRKKVSFPIVSLEDVVYEASQEKEIK